MYLRNKENATRRTINLLKWLVIVFGLKIVDINIIIHPAYISTEVLQTFNKDWEFTYLYGT